MTKNPRQPAMRYHRAAQCLIASLGCVLAGCASHAKQLVTLRDSYYADRMTVAGEAADKLIQKKKSDVDVLKLDRAMIQLAAGKPADAEKSLREIRDRFDALEGQDIAESAFSLVTDDTKRAYAGEDYEKILIRCFLSLSNLMHDGSDAKAYALQVTEKQQSIIQAGGDDATKNPKLAYKRVALGAYLNGALQEATHRDYDDAARSIQLVVNWEPDFKFGKQDLSRVTTGHHSEQGHGVLYVFTLIGRGPYKEERAEEASSAALLIADRILSVTGKHSLPPTIAPVKVPMVVCSRNRISTVRVAVDGQKSGETETITDIGRMAVDQYQAVFPTIMARAVVRRVVKKGAIYATKEAAQVDNPLVSLALDGVGVAWEATENADTRCWGLLPDKIQVLRVELPVGTHDVSLTPGADRANIGPAVGRKVTITDGSNTYLMATFPDSHLVGEVLVSERQ